ncbi:MAG: hypothetical protein MI810_11570 [Flavobacteriales bacterium]|nr:hypothetical protein [Flavobacteriales bacterium]
MFIIFAVMRHPERNYFDELKKLIVLRFRERQNDCSMDLSEWKGKEIELFQQDLQERVRGRISIRWFYDHLKSDREDRIPRIDILNLLCQYCGFESWNDFKESKKEEGLEEAQGPPSKAQVDAEVEKPMPEKRRWVLISGMMLISLLLGVVLITTLSNDGQQEYKMCFVDSDFGIPIADKNLEVKLLEKGYEGSAIKADTVGCLSLFMNSDSFQVVVRADYYITDTIQIARDQNEKREIKLKVDDYSMLIHQLSVTSTEDWERRRDQLDKMIHPDAEIFLVAEDNQGIEMFNKEEFIDRMTMPISTLNDLRILETIYSDEKIHKMRITQED